MCSHNDDEDYRLFNIKINICSFFFFCLRNLNAVQSTMPFAYGCWIYGLRWHHKHFINNNCVSIFAIACKCYVYGQWMNFHLKFVSILARQNVCQKCHILNIYEPCHNDELIRIWVSVDELTSMLCVIFSGNITVLRNFKLECEHALILFFMAWFIASVSHIYGLQTVV